MSSNLFIITAPSGAGKTTLIKRALDHANEIKEKVFLSTSHTTRPPRKGEFHGRDYFFINKEEFNQNIKNQNILNMPLSMEIYTEHLKHQLKKNYQMDIKYF